MRVLLVIALLAIGGGPADAQLVMWNDACSPSGFCASVYAQLGQYNPNAVTDPIRGPDRGIGATQFRFRVSNRQGVEGLPDPGAWPIRNVTIGGLVTSFNEPYMKVANASYVTALGGNVRHIVRYQGWGGAVAIGDALWPEVYVYNPGPGESARFDFNPLEGHGEILGCDREDSLLRDGMSTCGADAYVEFTYMLPGEWSYGEHVTLDVRGALESRDIIAVPEPGSFALIATGLLGLVGIRRRREGED